MLFNSPEFLLFLPLVFAGYWLLGSRLRLQNLFVVAASYVFYGWWDWRFLALIVFTSAWSWLFGLLEANAAPRSAASKMRLALSCVINLGILGAFKYYDFFVGQAAGLLRACGFEPHIAFLQVVLPVGVRFYTFQALSYTIDVYRRQIAPTRDPIAFFAFISFFPQLVAGPIERATNLLPQFLRPRVFDYDAAVLGCRQMLWGFFKKCVVADNCAVAVNFLLNDAGFDNGLGIWLGMLLFAFQIYGDFSGYSDIAIGCSRLFGISLMRNFAYPFFARDIAEFWRRWHISLTTWFRDYLYIPLGGSRCSKAKMVRNTFAIFLVSGLWHGANWTFVAWGAFHALLFLPLLLGGRNRKYLSGVAEDRWYPTPAELAMMLKTFLLAMAGWIVFRATSLAEARRWFCDIANFASYGLDVYYPHAGRVVFPMIGLMFVCEWVNRREQFGFARLPRWTIPRWLLYFALTLLVFMYAPGSQTFIYFQF